MIDRLDVPLFGAVLLVLSLIGSATTTEAADKPNIVVFLVDDMGPMDTSVPFMTDDEGNAERYPLNDYYRTPSMERLANQGTRLNNFYAMSVCSPTRTSILTGQNATRHAVTQWIRSENNNRGPNGPHAWNWTGFSNAKVTLPGVLRSHGYQTVYVGKAHFGPIGEPTEFPDNLGYDVNIAGCSWGQPGSYYGQDGYGNLKGNKKRAVPGLEKYHGTETFLTEALTTEAIGQIDAAIDAGKPFFLQFAPYAVHTPFQSNPKYAANYADADMPRLAKAYATLIESMDTALGDLMDHLQAKGIAEDTLVIFLGDNGGDAPLGPHHEHNSSFPLRGKKATHYEGGMRTPFIASWAKPDPSNKWQKKLPIAQGAIQSQVGTVMDIYPTVLTLAGIETPKGHTIDGFNLAIQLANARNAERPDRFLMHFPHFHRSKYFTSFRDGDWKVIYHYFPERNKTNPVRYELFNLKDDPFEKTNLANEKPQQLKELMRLMVEQMEAEGALWPVDGKGNPVKPIF